MFENKVLKNIAKFSFLTFFLHKMNLLSESSLLTADKLETLKAHKVFTSLDFVQSHNEKIANWIGCNVSEIIKMKEKILAANNSNPMRADRLCDNRLKSMAIIESGIVM